MFYIFQFIAHSIWLTEGHTVDAQRHLTEQSFAESPGNRVASCSWELDAELLGNETGQ